MIGPFYYHRTDHWSEHLKRSVPYGVLSLSEDSAQFKETLYLFHGGNGDDQQFVQAQLPQVIDEKNLNLLRSRAVRIVLPYIGVSLLHGSYSEYFFSELIPLIEGDFSRPRHIGGWSMGGFAALSAFFRRPRLFNSVGAHFASLIAFNFNDESEIQNYSKRVGVDATHLNVLLEEYRKIFTTFEEFKKSDPLILSQLADRELMNTKRIYFDVGSRDDFGLQEGAERLNAILTERGIAHFYSCIEAGRHDGAFLHDRINSLIHSALLIN